LTLAKEAVFTIAFVSTSVRSRAILINIEFLCSSACSIVFTVDGDTVDTIQVVVAGGSHNLCKLIIKVLEFEPDLEHSLVEVGFGVCTFRKFNISLDGQLSRNGLVFAKENFSFKSD